MMVGMVQINTIKELLRWATFFENFFGWQKSVLIFFCKKNLFIFQQNYKCDCRGMWQVSCFCFYAVKKILFFLCARNNALTLQKWVALRAPIFKNKDILKLCFQEACKDGHIHTVRLLCRFLTVDNMRAENNFAFRYACSGGHFEIVKFLFRFLTVEDMREENNFAFRFACYYGHMKIVKMLCQYLTVEDMRACNNEAFYYACYDGHIEIVKILCRFLTVEDMRANNNYAFQNARLFGHTAIVKLLSRLFCVNGG